jgi:hypothetical protein
MRLLKRRPSKTPQKSTWWRGYNWGLWVKFIVLVLYFLFIFISLFVNREIKARKSERQRSIDARAGSVLPFLEQRKGGGWKLGVEKGLQKMMAPSLHATLQHKVLLENLAGRHVDVMVYYYSEGTYGWKRLSRLKSVSGQEEELSAKGKLIAGLVAYFWFNSLACHRLILQIFHQAALIRCSHFNSIKVTYSLLPTSISGIVS